MRRSSTGPSIERGTTTLATNAPYTEVESLQRLLTAERAETARLRRRVEELERELDIPGRRPGVVTLCSGALLDVRRACITRGERAVEFTRQQRALVELLANGEAWSIDDLCRQLFSIDKVEQQDHETMATAVFRLRNQFRRVGAAEDLLSLRSAYRLNRKD